jgi:hypothetical protein
VSKVRKALLAALTAGVGSLASAYAANGKIDGAAVSVAIGAAAVAGLAVWRVPNAPQVR